MILTINVEKGENALVFEIGVAHPTLNASYHASASPDKIGETIGWAVQRIVEHWPEDPTAPEGMKLVPIAVSWIATSEVQVAIPENTPDGDEFKRAVRAALKPLPELVRNPTLSFVATIDAYGPKGPEGFVMGPETVIEIG